MVRPEFALPNESAQAQQLAPACLSLRWPRAGVRNLLWAAGHSTPQQLAGEAIAIPREGSGKASEGGVLDPRWAGAGRSTSARVLDGAGPGGPALSEVLR